MRSRLFVGALDSAAFRFPVPVVDRFAAIEARPASPRFCFVSTGEVVGVEEKSGTVAVPGGFWVGGSREGGGGITVQDGAGAVGWDGASEGGRDGTYKAERDGAGEPGQDVVVVAGREGTGEVGRGRPSDAA